MEEKIKVRNGDLALLLILRDRYLLYDCLNKNIRDQEFVVGEYVF